MNRIVDLNLWTPHDPIGKAEEFEKRIISENIEFNKLWVNVDRVEKASFIFKADEIGIKKWEELLKIYNTEDLSLEERRKQVYIEWNKRVIWTERSLERYLNDVVGVGNYDLTIIYSDYNLMLDIKVGSNVILGKLNKELRQIIPANLGITLKTSLKSKLYLGTIIISGEEITIYPIVLDDIEIHLKNIKAIGYDLGYEKIEIKPKG